MGVPLFCCSKSKKEYLIEQPNILISNNIHNNLNINIEIGKTKTDDSEALNFSNLNTKNNNKKETITSKNKRNVGMNREETNSKIQKSSLINKKCTFDSPKKRNNAEKPTIKYAGTLFAPIVNRISHIIDINTIIENNKEDLKKQENNNKNENNNNLENEYNPSKYNLIDKKRNSIIKILNLTNVNNIKIKGESELEQLIKNENENDINNNSNKKDEIKDNNNVEEKAENKDLEIILNPIMKEKIKDDDEDEDEEDEEEDFNNKASNEILNLNNLNILNPIPNSSLKNCPIEKINEPFKKKQIKLLKKIMAQKELIINEMDENTIQKIIDSVEYIKVKKGANIYNRDDKVPNTYYMLEKGKIEYNLDKNKYLLPKHCGIGTSALFNNSIKTCSLKSIEKSYLYKLPIEKYEIIVKNFFEEQLKIKLKFISKYYFFKGLKSSILDKIANSMVKIKYQDRAILVEQDTVNENIYIIKEGHITCIQNKEIIKKLNANEMFGEIGIYNSPISLYEYIAEPNTTILTISFEDLFKTIGAEAPKVLMQKIFEKAVKENEFLNKYFTAGDNLNKIFNLAQIKYYFNDIISGGNKEKKIFIPVSGSVFKVIPISYLDQGDPEKLVHQQIKKIYLENYENLYSSKVDNNSYMKNKLINKKYILEKGKLNIDLISVCGNSKYHILGDECLVIEINWADIEKNIFIPNKETGLSSNQRINLIKSIPFFKNLSPLKIFQLSNYVHLEQYKNGKIILENGPSSDKLYLIKSGSVQISIGDIIIQTLDPGSTFGEFTNYKKMKKRANFIAANSIVECYYIEKEIYEEIMEKEILFPLKKYLTKVKNNDDDISLDKLYYIRDLGSGNYGKVYLVHDENNLYAMKTANIQQMNEMKEPAKIYINEKNIMFSIKHPFIISIIKTFKTKEFLFFLLEYIDGISLRNHINNPKRELRNIKEAKFVLGTMALVLHYLQKQKIIHRDLKPENIMIDSNGYLKVIDFGIAIDITGKDYACSSIGTFHYMAPEVIKGNNYNNSVDYWSVGIIIYELFYGRMPFGHGETNPFNIYKEILQKKLYLPSENETGFNEVLKDLLRKNYTKRLNNFSHWKNYKLFKGFDFDALLDLKMEGFYKIDASFNIQDLNKKDISFIEYINNNLVYSNKNDTSLLRNNHKEELFEDF